MSAHLQPLDKFEAKHKWQCSHALVFTTLHTCAIIFPNNSNNRWIPNKNLKRC